MKGNELNSFTSKALTGSLTKKEEDFYCIEMQENTLPPASPPVLSNTIVITVQPQGQIEELRRPIPVNTLDWISTPRSQLTVLSGSHFLANVEQVEIQQIVDLSTLLGKSEKRFQYRVKVPKAETLFLAMEEKTESQSGEWNCCNLIRDDLMLNVVDQSGQTAFVINMDSSLTCIFNKLHRMTVKSRNLIGTVEENFNIIGSSFTVYDAIRNKLCNIYGPNVCGCCMYREAQFQVISIDGTHQMASLMHQWDNNIHDYVLLITFPTEMNTKLKSLLLAAAFLLEYMYFEQVKRLSSRN
ncbi:uncharacterized protein LOC100865698 [Apis florea]|uniref:uncharacterized protein LOC100865698 n=1 Tax=Apis florea TaxID=7463 RepID=UPI00062950C6|nr:uncharacterized protein LOC100865698 [Apis florea]